jgi:phage repressor protein C with HTH and peptisase S24 domain
MAEVLPEISFRERIKVLIDLAGSAEKLAKKAGISARVIGKYLAEESDPSRGRLVSLARASDVSIAWLADGEGPMRRGDALISSDHSVHYVSGELGEEFVLVPRYEVAASAGGGSIVHSEQIVDYLSFKAEWIRNGLGLSEKDLALINVQGDSMEPTLSNNDLILIDMRTRQVQDNSVYVIQFNGALLVKRIQRKLDGSVIVKGDNPVYEQEVLQAGAQSQLNVIGRVVWCGRRM